MRENEPFITGSRIYGTPTEESDFDLVVHMPEAVAAKIYEELFPGEPVSDYISKGSGLGAFSVFRFGKLNLIATHQESAYDAWKTGTEKCVKELVKLWRALTRAEAVTIIRKELDRRGIDD